MGTLRDALPEIQLVQVVHVVDESAIEEARHAATAADALLLDSGNPRRAIKELGGTGRTHDWSISRRIRESVGVPVFLAGGLTPDNVAEAVRQVGPYGVDVCSGLRTAGHLDETRIAQFVQSLRAAWE
jgi:phosphoribosylanthranilate isomerase